MESNHIEIELDSDKFNVEYDSNNAAVLSIYYGIINCKSYMDDEDYEQLFEEIQEKVSQIVE